MLQRLVCLSLLLATLTACTGSSAPSAAPTTPSPGRSDQASPSATPTVSQTVGSDLVFAAGAGSRLALYRLPKDTQRAEPVTALDPPQAQVNLLDVSISKGAQPTTCAIWHLDPATTQRFELRCYAWGDRVGSSVVAAGYDAMSVAVHASGQLLAWTDDDLNPSLAVARLQQGQATAVRRYLGDEGRPPGDGEASFTGRGAGQLAWAGADTIAISISAESDDGAGLRLFRPRTGSSWLYGEPVPVSAADRDRGYGGYDGVRSATATTAWALERQVGVGTEELPAQRAVQISLPSGRVQQVVSEPAAGRDVVSVSGGTRAVLYQTAANGQKRITYVRWPGQTRGRPVEALSDVALVAAA